MISSWPTFEKQIGGFELASLYMFLQVYLKTTEYKRNGKPSRQQEMLWKSFKQVLNFKIVYFV